MIPFFTDLVLNQWRNKTKTKERGGQNISYFTNKVSVGRLDYIYLQAGTLFVEFPVWTDVHAHFWAKLDWAVCGEHLTPSDQQKIHTS